MGLGTNDTSYIPRLKVGVTTDEKGRKKSIIGMRCKEGDAGAKPVFKKDGTQALDKDGNGVFRLEYDYIEGRIVKMERSDTDFGSFLEVTITEGGQSWILQLPRGERYWTDFVMRLPMLNLSDPVRLQPYSIENGDGKYNQGIAMRQHGQKIDRKWNSANGYEGGPPQAEYNEDEGRWMFGKRHRWLDDNVVTPIMDRLPGQGSIAPPEPPADVAPAKVTGGYQEEDDDLTL